MNRPFLLLAAVGIAFLTSCEKEKEITSLDGTTWLERVESNDGSWSETRLEFTSTHATITETFSNRGSDVFTGTYTFDPPDVVIVGDVWVFEGVPFTMPYEMRHEGTVKGRTMEIEIQAFDMIMETYLEMQ
jgi:hypothetical protein